MMMTNDDDKVDEILKLVVEHNLDPKAVAAMLVEVSRKEANMKLVCERCEGSGKIFHWFTGFEDGVMTTVKVDAKCHVCKGKGWVKNAKKI
jgi:RecJ-like exonuclease